MDYLYGIYDYFKKKDLNLEQFKKPDGYKNLNTSSTTIKNKNK